MAESEITALCNLLREKIHQEANEALRWVDKLEAGMQGIASVIPEAEIETVFDPDGFDPGPHECRVCDEEFPSEDDLDRHVEESPDHRACPHCDFVAHDGSGYAAHVRAKHPPDDDEGDGER